MKTWKNIANWTSTLRCLFAGCFMALSIVTLISPSFGSSRCAELPATKELGSHIFAWEKYQSIGVSKAERDDLVTKFCDAATSAADHYDIPEQKIENVSRQVIWEYLDDTVGSTPYAANMKALLLSHLGMPGLGIPTLKIYGVVDIVYIHSVDSIEVGRQTFAPWPKLLVRIGRNTLTGLNDGKTVCSVLLHVSPVNVLDVEC